MNYTFNQYINDTSRAAELLNQGPLNREEREELSNLQQILASGPPLVKLTTSKNNLPKVNKVRSMGGKRSIKKLKSKKKNKRKTTRRVRVKKGGHEREDVPHYHLNVKTPTGKTVELFALFAKSAKPREGITEISTQSATIGDLKIAIIDKEGGYIWNSKLNKPEPSWIMDPNNPGKTKPFTLFWKDKAFLNDNVKLRDIFERLPLYTHSKKIEPIVIVLNEHLEYPRVVETEVIKHPDYEDTPPNE